MMLAAILTLSSCASAAPPTAPELVLQGNQALTSGDQVKAMNLYEEADKLLPNSPEIAYNQGIAQYRNGSYDKAAERFTKALTTPDPELDAKARFNLGNCAYSSALKNKDKPEEALKLLETASGHFRDVLETHPGDTDARANLERAQVFIKQIKELQKQQQQKKNDQGENKPSPDSQPSTQPSQPPPESQPASRPESRPSPPPPASQPESQPGEQSQSQQQQGQEKQGEEQQAQQQTGEKKDEQDKAEDQKETQAIPATQQALSKEEAQRLLQMIRDKEQLRREEEDRRMRHEMVPVEKDW